MFGGVCWYCYWGWPKEVFDVYRKYVEEAGSDSLFTAGPSHIVWSDENFGDGDINWCLKICTAEGLKEVYGYEGKSAAEYYGVDELDIDVVHRSLVVLREVSESIRLCVPKDYDGNNPKEFPPVGVEIVSHDEMRKQLKLC